jgi:hypothetical protein
MVGKLITLPLRVSYQSARLMTHLAGAAAGRALSLAGRTIGALAPGRSDAQRPREAPSQPPAERYHAPPPPRPEPPAPVRPAPTIRQPPPEAPPVREPVHVSEQPELVREFAEPGAEEGAGASITVVEPWNGYELAAVRLYESRHRSRQTVLAAVDRQLRLGTGGAPA